MTWPGKPGASLGEELCQQDRNEGGRASHYVTPESVTIQHYRHSTGQDLHSGKIKPLPTQVPTDKKTAQRVVLGALGSKGTTTR
jgi:hypothetical protein